MNVKSGMWVLVIATLLAVTSVQAETGTQRLQHFMKHVKTLDATFTQEVVSDKGQIAKTAYGTFLLKRPGKFRWQYQSPSPQVIVSDGRNLWIHDIELEQVTVKPISSGLGSTPAAILLQRHDFNRDYVVLERPAREGLEWVDLRPKKKNGDFKRILIGLDDEGIQAMDLYDQFGQITMIRFQESQVNKSISNSKFKFTPPPGADVIGKPS